MASTSKYIFPWKIEPAPSLSRNMIESGSVLVNSPTQQTSKRSIKIKDETNAFLTVSSEVKKWKHRRNQTLVYLKLGKAETMNNVTKPVWEVSRSKYI